MPVNREPTKAKRPEPPKFPVWAPDGHMEMHPREVINDLVRHGTIVEDPNTGARVRMPWTTRDPKNGSGPSPAELRRISASTASDAPPSRVNDRVPTPRLDALRKELSELGVAPDPTWGIRQLEQAIAAKKAGQAVPKNDDEDEDAA
jgi:hypothetical protein